MTKRPVAFRVPRTDPSTGGETISKTEWSLFNSEEAANEAAMALGVDYQGLYVRDGTANYLDHIEAAADRLDSFVASLVNLKTLPDRIHVAALREGLPSVADDLRAALRRTK